MQAPATHSRLQCPLAFCTSASSSSARHRLLPTCLLPRPCSLPRARPCKREEPEGEGGEAAITCGEWSVEAQYITSGQAPQRAGAAASAATAAAAAAAAEQAAAKRRERKAKAAGRAEAARQQAEAREAAQAAQREAARREAEQKGRMQAAAIAAAQAEYEREAEEARRKAEAAAAATAREAAAKAAAAAQAVQAKQAALRSRSSGQLASAGGPAKGGGPASAAGSSKADPGSGSASVSRSASGISRSATGVATPTAVADSSAVPFGSTGDASPTSSSIPPEFRLPAGYQSPLPPSGPLAGTRAAPKPAAAGSSGLGARPAMVAPTKRSQIMVGSTGWLGTSQRTSMLLQPALHLCNCLCSVPACQHSHPCHSAIPLHHVTYPHAACMPGTRSAAVSARGCLRCRATTLACPPSHSQGDRQPSFTGVAAASGDVGAAALLAREAAAHGMTLEQYAAYQEELILQQVLQVRGSCRGTLGGM